MCPRVVLSVDAVVDSLKQDKMQQEAVSEALREADKPLARYKDDKDLDNLLKNVEREGDPMLAYITKKKQKGDTGKKGSLVIYIQYYTLNIFTCDFQKLCILELIWFLYMVTRPLNASSWYWSWWLTAKKLCLILMQQKAFSFQPLCQIGVIYSNF